MSDRTSAEIFGEIFKKLANFKKQGVEVSDEAAYFWDRALQYDFCDYQMNADKALIELGLAKRGTHPDYPGDEVFLYFRNGKWEP